MKLHEYAFFLEPNPDPIRQKYIHPNDTIRAKNIEVAMRRFARKHKMNLSGWQQLDGAGFRVFYIYRRKEMIYYVSRLPKRS